MQCMVIGPVRHKGDSNDGALSPPLTTSSEIATEYNDASSVDLFTHILTQTQIQEVYFVENSNEMQIEYLDM